MPSLNTSSYTMIRCPNPEHDDTNPSCAIYEKGAYCFSRCGYISHEQLKEWLGHDLPPLDQKTASSITYIPSPTTQHERWRFVLLAHSTLLDGPRSNRIAWFHRRGFTSYSIERFKFGHTGKHFVIPFWYNGEFRGYKLRRDEKYCDPDGPKYINLKGMPSAVIRPNPKGYPSVVVEGELDAYLLSQWGVDAFTSSAGSGSLSRDLQYERYDGTLYIATDMDEAGNLAAAKIAEWSRGTRIQFGNTGQDLSDYLCSVDDLDRGSLIRSMFRENICAT